MQNAAWLHQLEQETLKRWQVLALTIVFRLPDLVFQQHPAHAYTACSKTTGDAAQYVQSPEQMQLEQVHVKNLA